MSLNGVKINNIFSPKFPVLPSEGLSISNGRNRLFVPCKIIKEGLKFFGNLLRNLRYFVYDFRNLLVIIYPNYIHSNFFKRFAFHLFVQVTENGRI